MKDLQTTIIEAAITVYAQKGLTATFGQIAKVAEIKQPHIFYYFKDKKTLLKEVIIYIVSINHTMVRNDIQKEDNSQTRLIKHCRMNVRWALEYKEYAQILLLMYYMSTNDPVFQQIHEKVMVTGKERILEYLYMGSREGLWSETNLEFKAELIQHYLVSEIMTLISYQDREKNDESVLSRLQMLVETILK
ncbi:MAG: TetR/AcrR family transcriptional regulator [Halobacteriovoraceae bacterium]|nr:TetR/AcrR family transcriptional regulator [Halobacteriovoraceae bacterium]MCB9093675.1 TetR/AcrR family transcriptional regulator [Halobacteriovoraceae bacterium]